MTGTAAEVTPVRAIDDVEVGVGPVTLEIQGALPRRRQRPLGRSGATGSTWSRSRESAATVSARCRAAVPGLSRHRAVRVASIGDDAVLVAPR